jgi:predicted kinase
VNSAGLKGIILVLVGLPGSGKTTLSEKLEAEGWLVFDDYKANAIDDCSHFRKSKHFESLLVSLHAGRNCVVADVDFCKAEARTEAEQVLRDEVPDMEVRWIYFSNDIASCEANIRHQKGRNFEDRLTAIHRYSSQYTIPSGAEVRSVVLWSASTGDGASARGL